MPRRSALWVFSGLLLSLLGCASSMTGWKHLNADASGQGFLNVKSGYAVSPAWVSEPLRITGSSPVLGRNAVGAEVVYIGTADALLVAIEAASGRLLWRRSLAEMGGRSSIVSSPAVAADGGVLVVATTDLGDGRLQSRLHKVDRNGNPCWSLPLPDGGVTTGAPRTFTLAGRSWVLVGMLTGSAAAARAEILIIHDALRGGEAAGRLELGACPAAGLAYAKIRQTWSTLSEFPPPAGFSPLSFYIEPTPAVTVEGGKALIASADSPCQLSMLLWDGAILTRLWETSGDGKGYSSPLILSGSLLVVGRRDGKLQAFDALTGVRVWEYDAGEPVMSVAAAAPAGLVFFASASHLQAVSAASGGQPRSSEAGERLSIKGPTLSSPAVTAQCVYLPAREMLTVSYNFKVRSYNSAFTGNGLSSPAVGADGSVYVVSDDGSLWKYKGTF